MPHALVPPARGAPTAPARRTDPIEHARPPGPPEPSLVAVSRLVAGVSHGVQLLRDGRTQPLPGLAGHRLLSPGSPVVRLAHRALSDGQAHRSFLCPWTSGHAPSEHVRVTVLSAGDSPAPVLGAVLLSPRSDTGGLTARELEVLGLVVEGRSNQQVANRLGLAPRTVAAHVEHILHKLDAATRTVAAVRAVEHGLYLPSPEGA